LSQIRNGGSPNSLVTRIHNNGVTQSTLAASRVLGEQFADTLLAVHINRYHAHTVAWNLWCDNLVL
jgi:hypothetical protein